MKMLSKVFTDWCPYCKGPSDIDCGNTAKSKKQTRRIEERQWRKEYENDSKSS